MPVGARIEYCALLFGTHEDPTDTCLLVPGLSTVPSSSAPMRTPQILDFLGLCAGGWRLVELALFSGAEIVINTY